MATKERSLAGTEDIQTGGPERAGGGCWFPVFLAAAAFPVAIVGGLTIGLVGGDTSLATNLLWGTVVATLLLSSVAVYFDRKYVSSVSEWTPTRLYYFTFLGYPGMVIALVYVWRRHRILGVP